MENEQNGQDLRGSGKYQTKKDRHLRADEKHSGLIIAQAPYKSGGYYVSEYGDNRSRHIYESERSFARKQAEKA